MPINRPDTYQHNNPNEPIVLSENVRGGALKTASLATLLTDFIGKEAKLQQGVTKVYVVSEDSDYRLINIASISSLSAWKKEGLIFINRPEPLTVSDQETYTLPWDYAKKQLYGDYGHFEVWQQGSLQTVPIRFNIGEDGKPLEYIFTLDYINTLIFII